jgi:hypothetical protein
MKVCPARMGSVCSVETIGATNHRPAGAARGSRLARIAHAAPSSTGQLIIAVTGSAIARDASTSSTVTS